MYIDEAAKEKIQQLRNEGRIALDQFIRVSVTSGGCSGLTYQMDFDSELHPKDQIFEDKGEKLVTDLKSYLYLHNSTLKFSSGLEGKGFYFENPNATRECACGESFAI